MVMRTSQAPAKGLKDTWRPFKIGHGRALMVSRLLPAKWTLVEVEISEATDEHVTLEIRPVEIAPTAQGQTRANKAGGGGRKDASGTRQPRGSNGSGE